MKEAMWNKINSGKVEQSLTFRAGPGLGGGFEVDVPCFSSTLFLVVIGLLFVLVVALLFVVQLDQQLGRFLERIRKLFAARIPGKDHLWLFIFSASRSSCQMKIVVRQADTLKISTLSTNEQVEDEICENTAERSRNFHQPVVPVCRVITWLITHNDFWKTGDRASWKMRARPTWRNKSSTCATVIHFEKWRKLSFSKYMSSSSPREILEEIS